MREAEEVYSAAIFDSLTWESDSTRSLEGNAVYAEHCRRCHGTMGEGNTDYARERGLDVLSLVEADWPFGESVDSLRHAIFAGHEGGMPIFGVAGITPREIDASAYFIVHTLRPEVLGTDRDQGSS
jgi:mono/diheme cytochrome c family protein